MAQMEGEVHNKVMSRRGGKEFTYDMKTEGGTSGSTVRLQGKHNTIIGIHVYSGKSNSLLAPTYAGAQTLNQSEIDEINDLILDKEYQFMMDDVLRIEQIEAQCLEEDENEFTLGEECSPEEYNNLDVYNIEDSKLINYYDEVIHSYNSGQSFPE